MELRQIVFGAEVILEVQRMKITIEELEAYLLNHYSNDGIDQSLFMKLVEEIGEVAEVLNKKPVEKLPVTKIYRHNWAMNWRM